MLNANRVPQSLKALRQWVCWKTANRGGKPTKVPVTITGSPASSTDPATWAPFDDVSAVAGQFSGAGFVFAADGGFCGIDLDGCRDPQTGKMAEWARDVVLLFASYAEVSPSLTGVKIFLRGKLPLASGKKRAVQADKVCDKEPAVEAYDRGRYFAVTGMKLQGVPDEPQDRQEILDTFCREWFSEEAAATERASHESSRLSVIERAGRYLDTIPGAVAGQGGHNSAFKAACVLVLGFSLTPAEALVLLAQWNARCEPPWSEKELRHKIASADKQPGARGYLRDSDRPEDVKLPEYRAPQLPSIRPPEPFNDQPEPRICTLQAATQDYLAALRDGKMNLIDVGISEVDYAVGGGLSKNEMVVVCARPSHGKTAFALQALDALARAGLPTAFVTEEMAPIQLGKRTIQYGSDMPQEHWREQMDHVISDMGGHFQNRAPCYVVEGCGTVVRVVDVCRKLVEECGVQSIAIDYAQLLDGTGRDAYQKITQVCKSLRRMANELPILLFVLAQSSRAIEGRKVFIPMMSDVKETGQFEQDADVILFPVWPHRLDPSKPAKNYQVWVLKNRNRPINQVCVECEFDPSRQRIMEQRKDVRELKNYEPAFANFNNTPPAEDPYTQQEFPTGGNWVANQE